MNRLLAIAVIITAALSACSDSTGYVWRHGQCQIEHENRMLGVRYNRSLEPATKKCPSHVRQKVED